MNQLPVILIGFALAGSIALSSRADLTTNLNPIVDSSIHKFSADLNFGTEGSMAAGDTGTTGGNEVRRALLAFDLAGSIPAGATITSASLQVIVVTVPRSAVNSTFDLRRLLKPWNETSVTWNSASTGVPWDQPGATGTSDSASSASSTVPVTSLGNYVFASTPDLLADVQAAVDGSAPSFGWLLVSESEGTAYTGRQFGTHEDTVNTPVLTVTYTVPSSPPPPNPPLISQPAIVANRIQFSFLAQSNVAYVVESRANAASGTWNTVTSITAQASDSTIVVSDPITVSRNFYRVRTN